MKSSLGVEDGLHARIEFVAQVRRIVLEGEKIEDREADIDTEAVLTQAFCKA
ncbi:MAG: hypothetical protein H6832_10235 [Planctomycetes bacterium]|nr:hypothetical protein [Planctomycetota bacterium]MCB9918767.1 hypothetical protein [Planctomycetota bacterium]